MAKAFYGFASLSCVVISLWFSMSVIGWVAEPPRFLQLMAMSFACLAAAEYFIAQVKRLDIRESIDPAGATFEHEGLIYRPTPCRTNRG